MFTALATRIAARPKRTLVLSLLFVVVAAAVGGPVVGSLEDSGGFTADDADSVQAIAAIQAATGDAGDAARRRARADAVGRRVERREAPGRAPCSARSRPIPRSRRLRRCCRRATSGSSAATGRPRTSPRRSRPASDEEVVVERLEAAFDKQRDVTLGGSLFAQSQIGESVIADLGRAETLAFPILFLLTLLFFRGRAAVLPLAVGVTTIFGTFLVLAGVNQFYGLSIFALNLVIGLGLGLAIDYTLFLVTRFREELRHQGPGARRDPDDDGDRRAHGRLQRGDRRAGARHADGLPARLPAVDGHRGGVRRDRRRDRLARHRAGAVRACGGRSSPSGGAARSARPSRARGTGSRMP